MRTRPVPQRMAIISAGVINNLVSALRFPDGPQDEFEDDGAELTFQEATTVDV